MKTLSIFLSIILLASCAKKEERFLAEKGAKCRRIMEVYTTFTITNTENITKDTAIMQFVNNGTGLQDTSAFSWQITKTHSTFGGSCTKLTITNKKTTEFSIFTLLKKEKTKEIWRAKVSDFGPGPSSSSSSSIYFILDFIK